MTVIDPLGEIGPVYRPESFISALRDFIEMFFLVDYLMSNPDKVIAPAQEAVKMICNRGVVSGAQYDLVELARQWGFADVEVIDDDLGLSASGMVARPGFDRLVTWLCAGEVGAVLCFDASKARPQRSRLASPARTVWIDRSPCHRPRRRGRRTKAG